MQVQAYLNFDGRTEEAIEFYRHAVGAEVQMLMRYKESPEPCSPDMVPPGSENKVMHATFRIGDSTLMASDCHCKGAAKFDGISLSLTADNPGRAEKCFAALSAGGKVNMPLGKTFFSPSFGVVTDKFGVTWMVYVPGQQN
jgi:PhnB protein